MKAKIKDFFEKTGKELTNYLYEGADILINLGKSSYFVKVTEEGEVEVEENGKGKSDIEILTDEKTMNDLLSSSSLKDYREKMLSYIMNEKKPKVKILMERTEKNSKIFFRKYVDWLRRSYLLH